MDAPEFKCMGCQATFTKEQIKQQKQLSEHRSELTYECACGFTAKVLIDDELGEANVFVKDKEGIRMEYFVVRGGD